VSDEHALALLLLAADSYLDGDVLPFMREVCREYLREHGVPNEDQERLILACALSQMEQQADEPEYRFSTYAAEGALADPDGEPVASAEAAVAHRPGWGGGLQ
jgi:hypothetical protein